MKKILFLLVISLLLTGCRRTTIEKNGYARFRVIETYKDGREVVDVDTGKGYFIFNSHLGVVPLYDEYGHPYIENGWRDYGE